MKLKLVTALLGLLAVALFAATAFAGNGNANGQLRLLYGHATIGSMIVEIDTVSGAGTNVGPTGFPSSASGLATSRGPVPSALATFAQGTPFALLTDANGGDWVVAVNTETGDTRRVVKTSRPIGARGIAFGPDGVTLYVLEGNSTLSTIDTTTGAVTTVGNVFDGIQVFSAFSLEFDPASGTFYAITTAAGPSPQSLININPANAFASIVGSAGSLGIDACALARASTGDWFTVAGGQLYDVDVGLGNASVVGGTLGEVCGLVFAQERPLVIASPITVCHQPGPNQQTTAVPQPAVPAHIGHGDTWGSCPRPLGTVLPGADGLGVGRCAPTDRCIEFTVQSCANIADAPATLRVTGPAAPLGTVILTTGGPGVGFFGNTQTDPPSTLIQDFLDDLRLAPPLGLGYQVVELGWGVAPDLGNGLWEEPGTTTELACRAATAIDWIHQTLHLPVGGLFIAQGNSGGSAQIALSLAYYGQSDLDLVNLSGGPPHCPIYRLLLMDLNFSEQPLCVVGGSLFSAINEPILFGEPRLDYPNTTVRFFIGDAEPSDYIVDTAGFYHDLIRSVTSYQTVANTAHQVARTAEGLTALLDSITTGP